MLLGIFTGASWGRGKYFRSESYHVSGPRLVLIFTPLAVMRFTLHGRLHGIFTELHGCRGKCNMNLASRGPSRKLHGSSRMPAF